MLNPEALHRGEPLPSVRIEHELRYQAAAPLITAAGVWCDLGCGSGAAAAAVLDGTAGTAILVDRDEELTASAASRIPASTVVALQADLTTAEGLDRVRTALLAEEGERVVTCFETLEHLESFAGLVELLTELAERHATTVVLSVPDDEVGDGGRPTGSVWGRGAFEELRRALPAPVVLARQATHSGSVVAPHERDGDAPAALLLSATLDERARTHVLAAFGPGADRLAAVAAVTAVDAVAERDALRRREAHLAHDALELRDLRAEVEDLRARLRAADGAAAERPALRPAG